jgi:hypothetical protein
MSHVLLSHKLLDLAAHKNMGQNTPKDSKMPPEIPGTDYRRLYDHTR